MELCSTSVRKTSIARQAFDYHGRFYDERLTRRRRRRRSWTMKPLLIVLFFAAASADPVLESFALDLSSGTLALIFSEAISSATDEVDWTGVSLRTHVNGLEGSGVTLWNTGGEAGWGEILSTGSGLELTVEIHPTDLDEMKALYVGHNSSFTWLTLREGTFVALDGGEGNEPVYGTQVVGHRGMSVSELIEDTTSPTLDRFTADLPARELVLFFSEGVDLSILEPSELALSYGNGGPNNVSLRCSSAARGRQGSWREIVLRLDEPCATINSSSSSWGVNGTSSGDGNASFATASGFSSDWDVLVEVGVFQDNDGGDERGGVVFLNATSGFVTDLSAAANGLIAVTSLQQDFPDCQPCGNGTYRSEPCTEVYDAVCTACTEACPGGDHFILSPCTAETDLDCHRCTPCAFGTREVGECQQASDRVCEACTECEEDEYESRRCSTAGDDRICETCLRCSMSPEVAEACRGSPRLLRWQMENCCETIEGEKFPCADIPLENIRVSTREGRRHWVFEPSIPPVNGYSQLYWGRGRDARDGVTPRDELTEVEFRPGARSVFDDPRYVGQEGPTDGRDVS